MLQNNSVPDFSYKIQPFIITRNRNFKQSFVLPPSWCLSFCRNGTITTFSLCPTIQYHSQLQHLQISIAPIPYLFHVFITKCRKWHLKASMSRVCCLWRLWQRDWCHVCHMKCLICGTFPLSLLCRTLLAQLHKDCWLVLYTKSGYNNNYHLWCKNQGTAAREYKGTETYRNAMRHKIFILESVNGKKL